MKSEWKQGRIIDLIASLESGVSVNGESRIPSEDEYAVLKVSAVTYGYFDQTAAKPIQGKELKRAKCNPKAGQILISRASGTARHVGASIFVDRDYPYRFLPDKLWQTVPNPNVDVNLRWLAYYLASPKTRSRILNFATGTNIKNITKNEFLAIPVLIPPLFEQNAIVDQLSIWDEAIEKSERLIVAKKSQYEWLVNTVLCKSVERKSHVSNLMIEVSIRNRDNKIDRVLSVTNRNGFVLPEEQFERRVASADLSNYKIVERGQYAYNPSRINVGSIARLDDWNEGVLSPMYVIFKLNENKINSDYFLHWLSSYEAKQRIINSAQGSVRETVSFTDLSAIPIPLADLAQQKNIVNVLNAAKEEINLLENLLEKYRIQKSGLMQKLLTGEWHIKSNKEVA